MKQMKKKAAKNVMNLLSNAQEGKMPAKLMGGGNGVVTPNKVPNYPPQPSAFQKRVKKALHG